MTTAARFIQDEEARARHFDATDPCASFHDRFVHPESPAGRQCVYLCGNSLGLMPRTARDEVEQLLADWGRLAVRGHHEASSPWIAYDETLRQQLATLVGAHPGEVSTMNSLTTNLHLMMVSFYRPHGHRCRILIESPPFPSDYYAVTSQIRFHGLDPAECLIEMTPRPGDDCLRDEDILANLRAQGDRVALVLFSGIQYQTGQLFEMARIVEVGHEIGATVGFDLAHAVGNVPLELHDWNADFAVWCSYKYLNGGPGAPGGCFVHERHARSWQLPRFGGWWGTPVESRFRMNEVFRPAEGASGWQLSNPPMLSMVALKAALDLFAEVGMPALRAKSERLTGFLHALLVAGDDQPYHIITPARAERRGCQLSIRVPGDTRQLVDDLAARGFVVDSRPPDVLRVAPVPFSNRYHDAWAFAAVFREMLGVQ